MIFITDDLELNLTGKCCLYFYAQWIPFHKKMMIMLDKIQSKYDDVRYYAIDVDFFKNLCKRFSIDSIPVILLLDNGEVKVKLVGCIMNSALKNSFVLLNKEKK